MNLIKTIQEIFPSKGNNSTIYEKYSTFDFEYYTQKPITVKNNQLEKLIELIPKTDNFKISVIVENNDPATLDSTTLDIPSFIKQIENDNLYLEETESIKIGISIKKETSNSIITIYHFDSFIKFIEQSHVTKWLDIIGKDLKKNNFLKFNVLEDDFDSFWTKNIFFSNKILELNALDNISEIVNFKENCHFGNYDQYPYTPIHFHLVKRPMDENSIVKLLDRIAFIFSITSIFDITSIDNKSLHYKLNGYKTIQGEFDIDTGNIESKDVYIKIFEWIYSGSANIIDKLGLTRNILSIYSGNDFPKIDHSVYYSIQSGFKTYLQDNISKYIDIRNKISEQLMEVSNRGTMAVEKYLAYYQKSNITFVTFFISIFTIRTIITKNFTDIFSKETALIAYALIIVSAGYMVVSIIGLNSEIERLQSKYKNIKNRFLDLLIEEDINKILRDDQEFNDDIKYVKDRRLQYSILWIITVILFTFLITYLSPYASQILMTFKEALRMW